MKAILFIILAGLISGPLYADDLNLNQALNEALGESPKIQKSKSQSEEAAWKRIESYSGFLPSVSANATHLTETKYMLTNITLGNSPTATVVPQIIPASIISLGAQLPLFDGFASTNRYRSAKAMEHAAENDYEWSKFQTESAVTLQFFKTLGAGLYKDVAEQNLKTLEDHLKDVQLFKRAGMSTNYDVLRVEVQVNEAKMEVMNATDNVEIAKEGLSEMIGRDSERRAIVGQLPVLTSKIIESSDNENIDQRNDIRALQEKVLAFDYLKSSSVSNAWVPKLSFFGQYQYYNNLNTSFTDSDYYRSAYQIGFALTWNIFDGMASIAKSGQSGEQYYQAQRTLKEATLKMKKEKEIWRRKFLYFCSVYVTKGEDVSKASESVRLAKEGRKVGARTNTDLLDAETDLFRARAGVVAAQIGAIEALINYELSIGKKLYDFTTR